MEIQRIVLKLSNNQKVKNWMGESCDILGDGALV